jgi:hypothetical protein
LAQRPFFVQDILRVARKHGIQVLSSTRIATGASLACDGHHTIFYNPDLSDLKTRLVLGHELAHALLEHHKIRFKPLHFSGIPHPCEVVEFEADAVASVMLFPRTIEYRARLKGKRFSAQCVENYLLTTAPLSPLSEIRHTAAWITDLILQRQKNLPQSCPYFLSCLQGTPCKYLKSLFLTI